MQQDIDDKIRSAGYPTESIGEIEEASKKRFAENLDFYGEGKNWVHTDPRWFLWEASMNIAKAQYPDGSIDVEELADALNYLAFALDAERNRNDD